jgi:hypothetical protein
VAFAMMQKAVETPSRTVAIYESETIEEVK